MMRFCKDCKFASPFAERAAAEAKCRHPSALVQTADYYVTGKTDYILCVSNRHNYGQCKPEAIFFEPR